MLRSPAESTWTALLTFAATFCQSRRPEAHVYWRDRRELPGYYRAEKNWDLIVVAEGNLLAVIEFKAQVGPSFGNNFNNRVEEALGNASDLWAAYREGAYSPSSRPWLGYVFILEDCPRSNAPVKVKESHFKVFQNFRTLVRETLRDLSDQAST